VRSNGRIAAEPLFSAPELSHFIYAFGALATTQCDDPTLTWRPYRRFPVDVGAGPARFCLRAEDVATNVGPIHVYDLQ
jgi:hypothetical protein